MLTDIPHRGKAPPMKSLSTAVVDCEERVSIRKLARHGTVPRVVFTRNRYVRSTPPIKRVCAGIAEGVLLAEVGHGQLEETVAELVIAQAGP